MPLYEMTSDAFLLGNKFYNLNLIKRISRRAVHD